MQEEQIQIKLSAFEGPLDLLLHLVEKAEMDIQDIFVSEITAQYLLYMEQVDELDMDKASGFLSMAATLIYIKSRAILPRPPKIEEEDGEDPEEKLIRQLREYKQYKEVGETFEQMAELASHSYVRLPEEFIAPEQEIELEQGDVQRLWRAFKQVLTHKETPIDPQTFQRLRKDIYTIEASMTRLRSRLRKGGRIEFSSLFESREKMEMIVTFMAILELLNQGELDVEQEKAFSEIYLVQAYGGASEGGGE